MYDLIEELAKSIHESNREAVAQQKVVIALGIPFKGWDEISEEAKEGRRMAARFLLTYWDIEPKAIIP